MRWVTVAALAAVAILLGGLPEAHASTPGSPARPPPPIWWVAFALDGEPILGEERGLTVTIRSGSIDPGRLKFTLDLPPGLAMADPVEWDVDLGPHETRNMTARIQAVEQGFWRVGLRYPDPELGPRYPDGQEPANFSLASDTPSVIVGPDFGAWKNSFEELVFTDPQRMTPARDGYSRLYQGLVRAMACGPDGVTLAHDVRPRVPIANGTLVQHWVQPTDPSSTPESRSPSSYGPTDEEACMAASDHVGRPVRVWGVPEGLAFQISLFVQGRYSFVGPPGTDSEALTAGGLVLVCTLTVSNPEDGPVAIESADGCGEADWPEGISRIPPVEPSPAAPTTPNDAPVVPIPGPGIAPSLVAWTALAAVLARRRT